MGLKFFQMKVCTLFQGKILHGQIFNNHLTNFNQSCKEDPKVRFKKIEIESFAEPLSQFQPDLAQNILVWTGPNIYK